MTPEQIAATIAMVREVTPLYRNAVDIALLAEHDRANANGRDAMEWRHKAAQWEQDCTHYRERVEESECDAARWRAVRDRLKLWIEEEVWCIPSNVWTNHGETVDEAADRLIAEQEAGT